MGETGTTGGETARCDQHRGRARAAARCVIAVVLAASALVAASRPSAAAPPPDADPVVSVDAAAPAAATDVQLASAPSNDTYPGTTISGFGTSVAGHNVGASVQPFEHEGLNPDSLQHTVWYTWNTPTGDVFTQQDVRVVVNNADFDTELAVFVGPENDYRRISHVASNDDAGGTYESAVTFSAFPGAPVRIQVDGWGGAQGSFVLSIGRVGNVVADCSLFGCFPPADIANDFPGIALTSATGGRPVNNTTASGEPGEPKLFPSDASTWYSWTPPESGTARIMTRGTVNTTLAVFSGDSVSTLTPLAWNDDYTTAQSLLDVTVTAGQTYRVQLDGAGVNTRGAFGFSYTLNPPANDLFAAAQPIGDRFGSVAGTTTRALSEPGDPSSNGVWYSFTAPQTGTVTFEVPGCQFCLTAYEGSSLTALTALTQGSQRVAFGVTAGVVYRVSVEDQGPFELRWSYDVCDGRPAFIASSGTIAGTDGDDVIVASDGVDTIDGAGGNDLICAGAGNDVVRGGAGNDRVLGGSGNDTIYDGAGADTVLGEGGRDVMVAEPTPEADAGDSYDGGAEVDTVTYRSRTVPLSVVLDGFANDGAADEGDNVIAERVIGGSTHDTITGGVGDETLDGRGGNDTLNGGDGADTLLGGAGNDIVEGGGGNDTLKGGGSSDSLIGGSGDDRVLGGGGNDFINIQDGVPSNDSADGGTGTDTAMFDGGDRVTGL
jgi:Ca2+-binding RTX toxin-like protein